MSKNKLPNNLLCPTCENPIDFVKQIYEWDMYYGEDVLLTEGGAFINIICDKCDEPRISVYLEAGSVRLPDELQAKIAKDVEEIKKEKN